MMASVNKRESGSTGVVIEIATHGIALHGNAQKLVDAIDWDPAKFGTVATAFGVAVKQCAAIIKLYGMKRSDLGVRVPGVGRGDELVDAYVVADLLKAFAQKTFLVRFVTLNAAARQQIAQTMLDSGDHTVLNEDEISADAVVIVQ